MSLIQFDELTRAWLANEIPAEQNRGPVARDGYMTVTTERCADLLLSARLVRMQGPAVSGSGLEAREGSGFQS